MLSLSNQTLNVSKKIKGLKEAPNLICSLHRNEFRKIIFKSFSQVEFHFGSSKLKCFHPRSHCKGINIKGILNSSSGLPNNSTTRKILNKNEPKTLSHNRYIKCPLKNCLQSSIFSPYLRKASGQEISRRWISPDKAAESSIRRT